MAEGRLAMGLTWIYPAHVISRSIPSTLDEGVEKIPENVVEKLCYFGAAIHFLSVILADPSMKQFRKKLTL